MIAKKWSGSSRGFTSGLQMSLGYERRGLAQLVVLVGTCHHVTIAIIEIRHGAAVFCPEVGLPLVVATLEPVQILLPSAVHLEERLTVSQSVS